MCVCECVHMLYIHVCMNVCTLFVCMCVSIYQGFSMYTCIYVETDSVADTGF